ncbi:MAG TPA: 50S ribosomal protein L13 [Armatimonadota bacterium]|jgi:large subunit ribosomal protein L13|nr:50S ribosomal protein L13 [Armatimonadota bacterium]
MQKTESYYTKPEERIWYTVSAAEAPLGRVAARIAAVLRGKHKPTFTPHTDGGDFVVVINAEGAYVTGKKDRQKIYYRHSGYAGHLKEEQFRHLHERRPEEVVMRAVKGMLPHNKLGARMLKRLRVYKGVEHPHDAQQPLPLP